MTEYAPIFEGSRVIAKGTSRFVLSSRTGPYHCTKAEVARIHELLFEGRSVARVALLVGRSSSTVDRYKRIWEKEAA